MSAEKVLKAIRPRRQREPELMVSVESFAGNEVSIAYGIRLLSDNPIVKRWPRFFVPFSGGDEAIAARQSELLAERSADEASRRGQQEKSAVPPPKPTPPEDLVICIKRTGAIGGSAGLYLGEPRGIAAGQVVSRRYKLVRDNPENFVDVKPRDLKVEDALVALIELRHMVNGEWRIVYKNQWLHHSDPLAAIHPNFFVPVNYSWQPEQPGRVGLVIPASPSQITEVK